MRQLLSFASVAAAAALVFLLPSASSRAAGGGISFETPSVVDPIHTYGEPDIGVDPLGRVFVSGPTGTGTQRSVWSGSVDGGHTFRVITPGAPPTAAPAPIASGSPSTTPPPERRTTPRISARRRSSTWSTTTSSGRARTA